MLTSKDIDRALFECAAYPGERSLEIWSKVLGKVSWEGFTASQRRLLPAVWNTLSSHHSNFPGKAKLANLYRYTWARNNQLQRDAEQVIERLRSVGIPTLVLKGLALNQTVHQDMGMRPAYDFDLLVPFPQASLALQCLLEQGWKVDPSERECRPSLRLEQAVALRKGEQEFDLHWFALREARDPRWDLPMWEAAVPMRLGKVEALTLCPEHQLMHLLVNASREPENRYRYLLDLHAFLEKFGETVDFEKVKGLLRERHLVHRLSYIPLQLIGWGRLSQHDSPSLLDRCWSWCSRYVNDGSGELEFAAFPILDFWLHYAGRSGNSVGFKDYLQHRLNLRGWRDFAGRLASKIGRSIRACGQERSDNVHRPQNPTLERR